MCMDFPGGSDGKAPACNAGDPGSIPRSGRSSGEGNGNPLHYSLFNFLSWISVHLISDFFLNNKSS